MKQYTFLLLALLILPMAHGSLLSPTSSAFNSGTYSDNYQSMISLTLDNDYNTTHTWTTGGVTYLAVPEYTSSTACGVGQLQTTYNTTRVNMTSYEIRSDLFSEVGIALSASNRSTEFDAWYNTLTSMSFTEYGVLPQWVVLRVNNDILPSSANDTAIDGSVRAGMALYIASQNGNFSSDNRTKYKNKADEYARDVYQYETISTSSTSTRMGRSITRLPMGGGDCASSGIGCGTDMWIGYAPDIVRFFMLAYNHTANTTYKNAALDFTAAFDSVSLQKDTDADGFGVAPFNYNWDTSGSVLNHTDGGGVNSYHYNPANPQWDDSDAPRFNQWCDILRVANETSQWHSTYENVSAYCQTANNGDSMTSTMSCLQYFYNGTCSTNVRTGYYENGLGSGWHAWTNTTSYKPKVNESLTHYSFTVGTYDSTACGTALSYRGVRPTRALLQGMSLDTRILTASTPAPTPTPASNNTTVTGEYDKLLSGMGKLGSKLGLLAGVTVLIVLVGFMGVRSGQDTKDIIIALAVTLAVIAVAIGMAASTIGGLY